jgi:hypothetical protein
MCFNIEMSTSLRHAHYTLIQFTDLIETLAYWPLLGCHVYDSQLPFGSSGLIPNWFLPGRSPRNKEFELGSRATFGLQTMLNLEKVYVTWKAFLSLRRKIWRLRFYLIFKLQINDWMILHHRPNNLLIDHLVRFWIFVLEFPSSSVAWNFKSASNDVYTRESGCRELQDWQ